MTFGGNASYLRFKSDMTETPDGTVVALPGYGGSLVLPTEGERVELFDEEGNTCMAMVVRLVHGELLHLVPDWDTWNRPTSVSVGDVPLVDLMQALRESLQETRARRVGNEEAEAETRYEGVAENVKTP